MNAIDKLRGHFFPGGSPPSTNEVLRDAVLEIAAAFNERGELLAQREITLLEDRRTERGIAKALIIDLTGRITVLESGLAALDKNTAALVREAIDAAVRTAPAKKPRKKYKPRKGKNPREDEGADAVTAAPARAEPLGLPPPDGSPVPSPGVRNVGLEEGHNMAVALKRALLKDHAASLQTRPERD